MSANQKSLYIHMCAITDGFHCEGFLAIKIMRGHLQHASDSVDVFVTEDIERPSEGILKQRSKYRLHLETLLMVYAPDRSKEGKEGRNV